MFNNGKYTKWYFALVKKCQQFPVVHETCEKHHIIPRALGGSDVIDNIVKLTTREHYVCHKLLVKMLRSKAMLGNSYAAGKRTPEMTQRIKTAQLIAQNRPDVVAKLRVVRSSKEYREKLSFTVRQKMSDPKVRKKMSDATCKTVSQLDTAGSVLKTFASAKQAYESTGVSRSHISEVVNGKRIKAGGFYWRFEK